MAEVKARGVWAGLRLFDSVLVTWMSKPHIGYLKHNHNQFTSSQDLSSCSEQGFSMFMDTACKERGQTPNILPLEPPKTAWAFRVSDKSLT